MLPKIFTFLHLQKFSSQKQRQLFSSGPGFQRDRESNEVSSKSKSYFVLNDSFFYTYPLTLIANSQLCPKYKLVHVTSQLQNQMCMQTTYWSRASSLNVWEELGLLWVLCRLECMHVQHTEHVQCTYSALCFGHHDSIKIRNKKWDFFKEHEVALNRCAIQH